MTRKTPDPTPIEIIERCREVREEGFWNKFLRKQEPPWDNDTRMRRLYRDDDWVGSDDTKWLPPIPVAVLFSDSGKPVEFTRDFYVHGHNTDIPISEDFEAYLEDI